MWPGAGSLRYTKQWGAKVEDFPFTATPTDYRKPLDWRNEGSGYYIARMNGQQFGSIRSRTVGGRPAWSPTIGIGDHVDVGPDFPTAEEAKAYVNRSWAARAVGRPLEEIDADIDRTEEQRRLASAAGRPYQELNVLDQRLAELIAERDKVRSPEAVGTLRGKHGEVYDRLPGVRLTPEMKRSVLSIGQPLFRSGDRYEDDRLRSMRSQQRIAAEPVPGTPQVIVDGHGGWPQEALQEVANHPAMQQIVATMDQILQSFKRALGPEYQHARLDGLDVAAWRFTHGYNVIGQHAITVALHKALTEAIAAEGTEVAVVPRHLIAKTVAEEGVDTLIHELAHELFPAHDADFEALEKHLRGTVLVNERADAIEALETALTKGNYDGLNALTQQSDRAVGFRQSVERAVGAGTVAPGGPLVQAAGPEAPRGLGGRDVRAEGGAGPGPAAGPAGGVGAAAAPGPPVREAQGGGRPGAGVPAGAPDRQARQVAGAPQPAGAAPAPELRRGEAGLIALAPGAKPGLQKEATRATVEYFAAPIAPPPPYTLGGGTVTRPLSPNILTRLRRDKIIQDFGQALRDLGKGGLVLQGGISAPGALGQAHRQSGNVRLRYITDIDSAAHEFGHRLQDALGIRDQDLAPFTGELGALQHASGARGPTISEGWAEFWRLHAVDPLGAAHLAPTLYPWAEAKLRGEPSLDAAWQAFRNQIMELRSRPPEERVKGMIATEEPLPVAQQVREVIAVSHLRSRSRELTLGIFDATLRAG